MPVERNHLYRGSRTVARAVVACNAVCQVDTVVFHPHSVPNLRGRLFCQVCKTDCVCRANLGALRTLGAAISAFITHLGLHEFQQVGRRTEHLVRTYRHA